MNDLVLETARGTWTGIVDHLLPIGAVNEEAAFGFVVADEPCTVLRLVGWIAVPPSGFSSRSPIYLELTDEMRASVIKRAHDLGAGLVELHSHPRQGVAEFSPSDRVGLSEFVPHVRWRLGGRPYAAIVVAPSGFDALAWTGEYPLARRLDVLVADTRLRPTGRSTIAQEERHGS